VSSIPRNHWYVAAYGSEIGHDLFTRTICGEPIPVLAHRGGRRHRYVRPLCAPPVPAPAGAQPAPRAATHATNSGPGSRPSTSDRRTRTAR
jgi:hypothetical protein